MRSEGNHNPPTEHQARMLASLYYGLRAKAGSKHFCKANRLYTLSTLKSNGWVTKGTVAHITDRGLAALTKYCNSWRAKK